MCNFLNTHIILKIFYKYFIFYFLVEQFLLESPQSKLSNSSVKEEKRCLKNPVAEVSLVRLTIAPSKTHGPANPIPAPLVQKHQPHSHSTPASRDPRPSSHSWLLQGPGRNHIWQNPGLYKAAAECKAQPLPSQRGVWGIHLQQPSLGQCLTESYHSLPNAIPCSDPAGVPPSLDGLSVCSQDIHVCRAWQVPTETAQHWAALVGDSPSVPEAATSHTSPELKANPKLSSCPNHTQSFSIPQPWPQPGSAQSRTEGTGGHTSPSICTKATLALCSTGLGGWIYPGLSLSTRL